MQREVESLLLLGKEKKNNQNQNLIAHFIEVDV